MKIEEDESIKFSLAAIFVASLLAFYLAFYLDYLEQRRWEDFKDAHNCKQVAHVEGDVVTSVAPIIGGNGGVAVGVTSTPDKKGWKCDDGITYWK